MIRLEKVTKTVASGTEQLTILDAVDLFVPAGQFIAVTGPSGSGKSTLLSLVAGLDTPTSGDVYLAQQKITRMREDALADLRGAMVGIIFQSFHLIPSLTAYENVVVPMELANQPDPGHHARALIDAVAPRRSRPPLPVAALRRRAAARGDRARVRQPPEHPARRRADGQPRHRQRRRRSSIFCSTSTASAARR